MLFDLCTRVGGRGEGRELVGRERGVWVCVILYVFIALMSVDE